MNSIRKPSELDQIVRSVAAANRDGVPELSLLQAYKALTEGVEIPHDDSKNFESIARRHKANGRFSEAIDVFSTALSQYPDSLELHSSFLPFLREVVNAVEALGDTNPSDPQFLATYERLKSFGTVSMPMHFTAIEAFRQSGELSKAVDICVRLHRTAPNYRGLQQVLNELAKESGDERALRLVNVSSQ